MKERIITLLLFVLMITGFSQNLSYDIRGKYVHPVKKEKLDNARFISDIIPYYPSQWISGYVSGEILATCDGEAKMSASTGEKLSAEQISILNSLDLGTDVIINITYEYKNPVTGYVETSRLNYSATLVPEIEAEYPGGHEQMTQYIEEHAINRIPDTSFDQIQPVKVRFTVDKEGKIADAQLFNTSGDPKIDTMLLKAINKMPKWSPAKDSMGTTVEQEFEFSLGNMGC